jgi:hypothetical protein
VGLSVAGLRIGGIFFGHTPSECRKAISAYVGNHLDDFDRYVIPCCGSFATPEALVAAGAKPENLFCSDISLYSSVLGYILDPERFILELGFELHSDDAKKLVDGLPEETDFDIGASILLVMKFAQLRVTNEHLRWQMRQFVADRKDLHCLYVDTLKRLNDSLGGLKYEIRDANQHLDEVAEDKRAFAWYAPPYQAGDYPKMFDPREHYTWNEPEIPDMTMTMISDYLTELGKKPVCAAIHVRDFYDVPVFDDPNWRNLFVELAASKRRRYYVFLNREVERTFTKRQKIKPQKVPKYLVYDNHEINESTEVALVDCDEDVALYYYDLFVKRFGMTVADCYYLFTVDRMVAGVVGIKLSDFIIKRDPVIHETFGLIGPAIRYKRLNRLKLMMMTTREFFDRVHETYLYKFGLPPIEEMRTTVFSKHPEAMGSRGIFKKYSKEQLPDGTYHLKYKATPKDKSVQDCLSEWLEKHSHAQRDH